MKVLCILLLSANVGYFAWEFWYASKYQAPLHRPLPKGVARLQLLAEVSRDRTPEPPSPAPTPTAVITPTPSATPQVSATPTPSPTPTAAPTPSPEPQPAQAMPPSAPAVETACIAVGPLPTEADAQAELRWMKEKNVEVKVRPEEKVEAKRFYVLLDEAASTTPPQARVDELKAKGIKDVMPVHEGELKGRVSLGFYKTEESANKRMEEMKAASVPAILVPRHKGRVTYWLDVTGLPKSELPSVRSKFKGRAHITTQACVPIATPEPSP